MKIERNCQDCKHFTSSTLGNGWDEPMDTEFGCALGIWEETELDEIEMASICEKYEWCDWGEYYRLQGEAEEEYYNMMKEAEKHLNQFPIFEDD